MFNVDRKKDRLSKQLDRPAVTREKIFQTISVFRGGASAAFRESFAAYRYYIRELSKPAADTDVDAWGGRAGERAGCCLTGRSVFD